MQEFPQHDQDISFAELKAENIELRATVKALTERNETLARLVLDLQEIVNQLKNEINRLKGQKARPKFPSAKSDKSNKGKSVIRFDCRKDHEKSRLTSFTLFKNSWRKGKGGKRSLRLGMPPSPYAIKFLRSYGQDMLQKLKQNELCLDRKRL